MKLESINSKKFEKIENEKIRELKNVRGGALQRKTESKTTGIAYVDNWYLFKENNPSNIDAQEGSPEDGHMEYTFTLWANR